MCTNSARLVNSLECYMDDLVECFEDFVKKSLFIITVAVGALIMMLGYLLKTVTERQMSMGFPGNMPGNIPPRTEAMVGHAQNDPDSLRASFESSMQADGIKSSRSSTVPKKSVNSIAMPCLKKDCHKTSSAGANTDYVSSMPSFDEKVLRNIGLSSCSKSCMQSKRSILRNNSASRITLPSMATCIPNHHLSTPRPCTKYVASRNSCCSMCCADDDRR